MDNYRVFLKRSSISVAYNNLTTQQISLYLVPLRPAVLGECGAVYKNNPHTIEEEQQEISAAVISVSEETSCRRAKFPTSAADVQNFRRRLQMALDADGSHIENVFMLLSVFRDY
jgi:hypothetical protein